MDEEFLESAGVSILQLNADNLKEGAEFARRGGFRVILTEDAFSGATNCDVSDLLLKYEDVFHVLGYPDETLREKMVQWRQESRSGSVLVCVARLPLRKDDDMTNVHRAMLELFNAAAAAWNDSGIPGA